jgi:hypothetical protein
MHSIRIIPRKILLPLLLLFAAGNSSVGAAVTPYPLFCDR